MSHPVTPAAEEWLRHFSIIVLCPRCDHQFEPALVEVDDTRKASINGLVTVGFAALPACPVCSVTNAPGGDS